MKGLRWTDEAVSNLLTIKRYIAQSNPAAASEWVAKIRRRAEQAAKQPRAGRMVPEVAREDVREVFVRNYRILYRVIPEGISVLTVFEGHRLLRTNAIPSR